MVLRGQLAGPGWLAGFGTLQMPAGVAAQLRRQLTVRRLRCRGCPAAVCGRDDGAANVHAPLAAVREKGTVSLLACSVRVVRWLVYACASPSHVLGVRVCGGGGGESGEGGIERARRGRDVALEPSPC
eukprot:scaffold12025_cov56-Isochrysis_galbana.AAC.1